MQKAESNIKVPPKHPSWSKLRNRSLQNIYEASEYGYKPRVRDIKKYPLMRSKPKEEK